MNGHFEFHELFSTFFLDNYGRTPASSDEKQFNLLLKSVFDKFGFVISEQNFNEEFFKSVTKSYPYVTQDDYQKNVSSWVFRAISVSEYLLYNDS